MKAFGRLKERGVPKDRKCQCCACAPGSAFGRGADGAGLRGWAADTG